MLRMGRPKWPPRSEVVQTHIHTHIRQMVDEVRGDMSVACVCLAHSTYYMAGLEVQTGGGHGEHELPSVDGMPVVCMSVMVLCYDNDATVNNAWRFISVALRNSNSSPPPPPRTPPP